MKQESKNQFLFFETNSSTDEKTISFNFLEMDGKVISPIL